MRNYIEFYYNDENKLIAEIHKQGKVRIIRNEKNLNKLIKIAEKYGYKIDEECFIDSRVFSISREYEEYAKKKSRLNILGNITSNMKLSKKNKTLGATVVAGSLATVIAISSITGLNDNTIEIDNSNETRYEQTIDDEMESESELQTMLQEEAFHYSYENRQNEENISNARRYEDLFQKYGNMYGIDSKLLIAIAAQESCGDHYNNLNNGPAEGIMQIEKSIHIDNTVSAYNFETGEINKILVTEENLQDLETNIQIGTMILRTCIEDNNYNIPLAIQTYNLGPGNMSNAITMCCNLENIDENELRNNPTNNEWLRYRAFLNTGDPEYVEHVFSFLKDNTKITILDRSSKPISITLSNDYQKKI